MSPENTATAAGSVAQRTNQAQVVFFDQAEGAYTFCNESHIEYLLDHNFLDPSDIFCIVEP